MEVLLNSNYLKLVHQIIQKESKNIPTEVLKTIIHGFANLCSSKGPAINAFLSTGSLNLLLEIYSQSSSWSKEVDYLYAWLCSNILYMEDSLSFEEASDLTGILCRISLKYPFGVYPELDNEAVWAFFSYSKPLQNKKDRIENLDSAGILRKIVQIVNAASVEGGDVYLIKPTLATIGNAFTVNDEIIEKYLDFTLAQSIITYSKCESTSVSQDALWTISNIMTSTPELITKIATKDYFNWMTQLLRIGTRSQRLEVSIGLTNFFMHASPEQVENALRNHIKV